MLNIIINPEDSRIRFFEGIVKINPAKPGFTITYYLI